MANRALGILHPGEMGISIAASAQNSGCEVYWVSAGRSDATRGRAAKFGLREARTLEEMIARCDVVVSVCPPHAAESLADNLVHAGFDGLFVEANAIAPDRTVRLAAVMTARGVDFVDGGIIGLPAWSPHTTCLYLSGPRATDVAPFFSAGPLDTQVLGTEVGQASALKMCYAAHNKGSVALLAATLATAEALGVRAALSDRWRSEDAAFPDQALKRLQRSAPKAWRFVGEMEQISHTFSRAGTPGEFHMAAAAIFERLAVFKDTQRSPTLDEMLDALNATEKNRM
jgi:3-hydroxyisobutyrate dehydrogenase-like beta-hydroxyacid dehydrogenase